MLDCPNAFAHVFVDLVLNDTLGGSVFTYVRCIYKHALTHVDGGAKADDALAKVAAGTQLRSDRRYRN